MIGYLLLTWFDPYEWFLFESGYRLGRVELWAVTSAYSLEKFLFWLLVQVGQDIHFWGFAYYCEADKWSVGIFVDHIAREG